MQKSKLTLYIFIALVLGVIAGYLYNIYVVKSINDKLSAAESAIKKIDVRVAASADTTTVQYKQLKKDRAIQTDLRKAADIQREDKLEWFTILSTIFLNLIKMIVGPLVFSTLVVGV